LAYLLLGEVPETRIICRQPEFYEERRIRLIFARVAAIDLTRRQVRLADGNPIAYDTLLLATGSTAVPATFPGSQSDGVVYLDTLTNVKDILRRIKSGMRSAVIVGGGITAMELAEGLAHHHVSTHYLLRKKTIWSALLSPDESKIVESHAQASGVQIHYNEEIAEVIGANNRVVSAKLISGKLIACDLIGAAIGVRPNVTLAKSIGLKADRGIVVNEYMETSVPGVYAAGDAAQVFDQWSGDYRVDDLWPSAIAAGRAAGKNMSGLRAPYIKGVPFNAALVFGVHITAIGQAGVGARTDDDPHETLQYQSRGSSETFWARPGAAYTSAWSHTGDNSMRLTLQANRIAGALILGHQDLANPLRDLIGQRVDISTIRARLQSNDAALGQTIRSFWEQWRRAVTRASARPLQVA